MSNQASSRAARIEQQEMEEAGPREKARQAVLARMRQRDEARGLVRSWKETK